MKGLLIKDIMLMKMQKSFFLVITVLSVVMAYSMDNISFIMGYLCFVMPLFALSTISYDEFDNGSAFLFSLPISRKSYVVEKYCFGLLLGIGALILGAVLTVVVETVKGAEDLTETLTALPFIFCAMTVLLSVFIPVQIKFGGEKSRFVIIAIGGITVAIGYAVLKTLTFLGVDVQMLANTLSELPIDTLIAGAFLLTLCITALSIGISIGILEKKEF